MFRKEDTVCRSAFLLISFCLLFSYTPTFPSKGIKLMQSIHTDTKETQNYRANVHTDCLNCCKTLLQQERKAPEHDKIMKRKTEVADTVKKKKKPNNCHTLTQT